jgi:ElaB/YqjD/DUF883 family membrane-anchored ribosome-binding protein
MNAEATSTDHLSQAKKAVTSAVNELKETAAAKGQEVLHDAQKATHQFIGEAWEAAGQSAVVKDMVKMVQENPVKSLITAVGIGLVVGLSLRR